ncbi:MAG: glycosyltransferase family 39 protein [Candidatus Shapirobacteria bacterium]|nr:glycosyltransferase family 39 protein [Candidatus Shapirobacteria bacterium]
MLTRLNKHLIWVILLLAFFVRAYQINVTPALNPDEAAIGYDAYSLIQTGKDEHGISWPLHFKSFGDYKPGGYFYLVLPFVKLMGLTPLAVRLPNLILSIITIYFLYKLIFLLSKSKELSLLSALILAISPWHIHFSRGAWESSAALSFIIIGTYFFYISKVKNFFWNFSLFVIFFALSLYIYHSARIFAPLIALSYILTNLKLILTKFPKILFPLLIGVLLVIPVGVSFLNNGGATRFGGVGLTADQGPLWRANELLNQHQQNLRITDRIIHNQKNLYLISWGEKYFSHFDLNYLFISGDEVPRSKVPDMGQFYLIELLFLLLGLVFILKFKQYSALKPVIFSWLIFAPLASSLTFQAPSALRSLPLLIPLSVLISIGIYQFFLQISKTNKLKIPLIIITSILFIYSFTYYLDAYFIHYPKRYPFAWQYGFDELVPYVMANKDKYNSVYITDKYDQPYILFLFYSKYSPSQIQKEIKLTPPDKFGFSTVNHFSNLYFQKIDWDKIPSNSLVVTSDETVPVTPLKNIYFPNKSFAFKIYIKP